MSKSEFILCAANYYNDGSTDNINVINITEGYVVCGRRHHNCIHINSKILGFPYSEEALKIVIQAQIYIQRIDYLLSGDDGEESFLQRLKKELNEKN